MKFGTVQKNTYILTRKETHIYTVSSLILLFARVLRDVSIPIFRNVSGNYKLYNTITPIFVYTI